MSGFAGLASRIKKCQKLCFFLTRKPIRSFAYMDENGEMIIEEGVEYNERGVLLIPLPMTIDEWEEKNIREDAYLLRYQL